jgi:gluconate 5-dehydrogenase
MKEFRLDGELALITGGSKGIGFGIARGMARAGADVILTARNENELECAAAELRGTGRRVVCCALDLRETGRIPQWFDGVVSRHGRPGILVNAAGTIRRAPAEDLAIGDWDDTIAVNLTAAFVLSQAFARHCVAAGAGGSIINIASMMTFASRPTTAAYTASKGGIGQLTKALAVDWASRGIRVNAIAPGYIRTGLNQVLQDDPEFSNWVEKRTPLGRWGTPEDIAPASVFLASRAAAFITGQILAVDGGWISTF